MARADGCGGAMGAGAFVVGCDSMLEIDGRIVGKPGDPETAVKRWRSMRGATGTLHTGHTLVRLPDGATAEGVSSTVVHFARPSDAEIEAYVATGEPLWCAGAFTIDGLGGAFIEGVEGDPHGVVGLSLPLLRRLVIELGGSWTDLWAQGRGRTEIGRPAARGGAVRPTRRGFRPRRHPRRRRPRAARPGAAQSPADRPGPPAPSPPPSPARPRAAPPRGR